MYVCMYIYIYIYIYTYYTHITKHSSAQVIAVAFSKDSELLATGSQEPARTGESCDDSEGGMMRLETLVELKFI